MENEQVLVPKEKRIKISKKKFKSFIVVIIVLLIVGGIGAFFILGSLNTARTKNSDNEIAIPCIESPGISCPGSDYEYRDYDTNTNKGISDTREFLKVGYNAEIKTREVKDVMRDVKDAIETADGRIDAINESTKSSYVRFVVPKSQFEDFRDEIESLTKEKLYTETISGQNKLSEKQSIEQREERANDSLTSLQNQLTSLNSRHNSTLNSYQIELTNKQKEITNTQKELNSVRLEIQKTTDQEILVSLRAQETTLVNRVSNLKQNENSINQKIATENSQYSSNKQNLDSKIGSANNEIVNVAKQDENFTENVETVDGYINVDWISYWDMAKIYSPIHPTFVVIILVLVLFYYFVFRKVEFV